jgi:formate dehydrogenase maturation protein FdhE
VAILFDLTMMGDMLGVEERALLLKEMNEQFNPFADKVIQLAKNFEEEDLLTFIGQFMDTENNA